MAVTSGRGGGKPAACGCPGVFLAFWEFITSSLKQSLAYTVTHALKKLQKRSGTGHQKALRQSGKDHYNIVK